jgi:hypothetical protein
MVKGHLFILFSLFALSLTACDSYSTSSKDSDGDGNESEGVSKGPLQKKCPFDATNIPCSSMTTRDDGTVVEFGPYGAYIEQNVGNGFEVPKNPAEDLCGLVTAMFGEDPEITADLTDLRNLDLTLYTVFRPAKMVKDEKYPIIVWGNGTCAQPGGYGTLLSYLASYGFVIFAANCRYTAGGAMFSALDYAFSANEDPDSPYYQRLDTTRVGAMGHSQGGEATIEVASDDRVKAAIIFNGGTSASKPYLAIGGDHDMNNTDPEIYRTAMDEATVSPAAFIYYHNVPVTGNMSGHLTLMLEPERVVEPTRAWWQYMLEDDATARDLFAGESCGLCGKDEAFEYGSKGIE